jgi:hypothetical protein
VEPLQEVPDTTVAVLGLPHEGRQLLGEVGHRLHQGGGEQHHHADEGDEGHQEDYGHRNASRHSRPLDQVHRWREQEHDEDGDHRVEDDRAQDPEQQDDQRIDVEQHEAHQQGGDDGSERDPS